MHARGSARDRGRRRTFVVVQHGRASRPASASTSVGSTSNAASPATSGIAPARVGDDGHVAAHRFEDREPEPLVAATGTRRRSRRPSSAWRVAVVDRPGEHDARARRSRASAAIAASTAGRSVPSRPAITRRTSESSRLRARRTPAPEPGRFLRGSMVLIASTYGVPPIAPGDVGGKVRGRLEPRNAERHDCDATARRAGPARTARRSRRPRTPTTCGRWRRARSRGATPVRRRGTSGVHNSGKRTNEQSYTVTSVGYRLGGAR